MSLFVPFAVLYILYSMRKYIPVDAEYVVIEEER